jgi:alkyl hydroperoxide reductase subunit AhpC
MAALAEQQDRFAKMGAELITVSTDTEFVHLAWKRDEKELADVKYAMGADPTGNLSRLFGVYDENTGLALRGVFIISPEGTLFNSEVNFYNMGRNIDELMRKFKANLYLSRKAKEGSDEGCPSKWKDEGDKTLKPGPEMVGRVHEALQD